MARNPFDPQGALPVLNRLANAAFWFLTTTLGILVLLFFLAFWGFFVGAVFHFGWNLVR